MTRPLPKPGPVHYVNAPDVLTGFGSVRGLRHPILCPVREGRARWTGRRELVTCVDCRVLLSLPAAAGNV